MLLICSFGSLSFTALPIRTAPVPFPRFVPAVTASRSPPEVSRLDAPSPASSLGWFSGSAAVALAAGLLAGLRASGGGLHRRAAALRAQQGSAVAPGEKVVGIDLGTTNSAVAAMEAGSPTIIPNSEGSRTTPSVVAYSKTGELLVGEIAKRQGVVNPTNTFYSVKRFVGRKASEVTEELKEVAYEVTSAGDSVQIDCPQLGRKFAPEEISAQVIRKLGEDASKYLSAEVKKAVITVPAYFNDSQRQATKDAGQIAGLDVLRIVNEPTAASLAYGLEKKNNETILVFDLGGGTFDVSVLEVGDGVCEVLSTNGDTHLGGDDFDKKIVDWLASEFMRREGIDLLKDKQALQRLTEAAEKVKKELSNVQEATISLPFISADSTGPKHIEEKLTRAKFESLVADLVARCRRPCEQALRDAKLTSKDLNEIVLVGGSTRIPAIQALVTTLGGGRAANKTVNPDEVVAIGAAVQAGVLAGEVTGIVLLDVTPLSLGVETLGGVATALIPRNTTIPTKKTEVFSTAVDAQPSVEIVVVQGERQFARDNKQLGTFRLDGIPAAPRGTPQIEVTFDIDANGLLSVAARDRASGKEQTISITGSSTLDEADVDRMVREAEANAAEDGRRKEAIDARNAAEALASQAERQIENLGDKVPPELRAELEPLVAELRAALSSSADDAPDASALRALTDKLQEALMRAGQAAYAAAEAEAPPEPSPSAPPPFGEGEVIDVEGQ